MTSLLRSAWNAPGAAPPPPRRVWRDWALVVLVALTAVLEAVFRTDLPYPLVAAIVGIAVAPTLLWRRTRPLLMLAITVGAVAVGTVLLGDSVPYASGVVAFTLYALFRWGNGRALVVGSGILLANLAVSALTGTTLGDLIGEAAFLGIVLTLGVALRFRAGARMRELDRAKLMEREMLARDLHDTVAHHVSAIAIRAQAGLATAALNPAAATDALGLIEEEASKTLAEMRSMVRVLRQGEAPELAPGRTFVDIEQLTSVDGTGPRVDMRVTGDTASIPPIVAAAVYRLAQESVTNARRHARGVSLIDVVVDVDKGGVRLTVSNDGEPVPATTPGYGITGMMERAALLGGVCESGRAPGGGWTVTAVLPRVGWTT
ncbi:histidine kinase [Parafrigoribacterium mesophilum]|uniref:sensor histidine kinase n=1 Tax=Parafrigoribacterium mesophilum TaxID=433646 RepID=UPI0031FC58BC